MSQKNAPHELYIEQVKSGEKKKKRKYLLLLLLLLLLGIAGGGGLFSLLRSPQGLEYRTFNKTDLDLDKVKGILSDKNVRIRILDYERGRLDTINSIDDYNNLYGDEANSESFAADSSKTDGEDDPNNDTLTQGEDTGDSDSFVSRKTPGNLPGADRSTGSEFVKNSGPLKSYKLDIIGKRVAGEILSFIITDYNPSIKYNLDFGNGVIQDAKEITLYMYPNSGRFTLNLTATDAQFNRSKTNEYLEIKEQNKGSLVDVPNNTNEDNAGEEKIIASDWVAIENTNTDTEQKPDGSEKEKIDPVQTDDSNESTVTGTDNETNSGGLDQPRSTVPTELVDTKTASDFDASKIKEPLTTAQKAPSFPGGTKSMYSFLNQHISYPQQARDYEVEGKVYVQFEVDRGGTIKNPKVVKKLGYGCDEEALRIVKLMPTWEPARHMNQVVPYLYTLPVTFRLVD